MNGKKKHTMGNFRMKNFTGLHGRAGLNNPQGNATTKSSATAPITQRSKSPLKMNEALVQGEAMAAQSFNNLAGNMKPVEESQPMVIVAPPAEEDPKAEDLNKEKKIAEETAKDPVVLPTKGANIPQPEANLPKVQLYTR